MTRQRHRPTWRDYGSRALLAIGCGWIISWAIDGPWNWVTVVGCVLTSIALTAWLYDRHWEDETR